VRLAPEFEARFEVIKELRRGAEGDVVVVRERAGARRELVLKHYHRDLSVDHEAVELLRDADPDHVVEVVDFGVLDDQSFFEVLEFCPIGSLRDVTAQGRRLDFDAVTVELAAALEHVQSLGIVHRDLKPENVLVRSLEPLDLALGDFGLVRHLAASVRLTRGWGTPEYMPPEAAGLTGDVEVTGAWDWWSLGMVLAELAAGQHPLALPDGTFPSPARIANEINQRTVELTAITDPRRRLLCQGLLLRDRRSRWGIEQVTAWIDGDTPPVNDTFTISAPADDRSVLFADQEITNPAALAAAFQARWDEAQERLFQDPDTALIEETIGLARAAGRTDAADLAATRPTGDQVPRHFARLLIELDPHLTPTFNGITLTPHGLEAAATRVHNDNDQRIPPVLTAIRRHQILRSWRHLPGMEDATHLEQRWTDLQSATEATAQGLPLDDHTRNRIAAYTLLVAIDQRHLATWRDQLAQLDHELPRERPWWAKLAHNTEPAAVITALATHPTAQAEAAQARETARQRQLAQQAETPRQEAVEAELIRQQALAASADRRRHRPPILATEIIGAIGVIVGGAGFAGDEVPDLLRENFVDKEDFVAGIVDSLAKLYTTPGLWFGAFAFGLLTVVLVTAGRHAGAPRYRRYLSLSYLSGGGTALLLIPVWPLIGLVVLWLAAAAIAIGFWVAIAAAVLYIPYSIFIKPFRRR
jgi:serine/threonine protein kinase